MTALDRRRFVQHAAAALVCAPPSMAHADSLRGCCILPDNAQAAYRTLFNKKPTGAAWERRLSTSSGISQPFEAALGEVLADMSGQFGVVPGFGFYDDLGQSNAVALDKSVVRNTSGMIAFGRTMLRKQLALDPAGISVAAICAHEFGHIYQYSSGFYDEIKARYPMHIIELHADFMAGAYLHHFEQSRPSISLQRVGEAWEEMGSSRFTAASTHGTSAMRLDAIQAGYFWVERTAETRQYRVAKAGVEHVRRHARG